MHALIIAPFVVVKEFYLPLLLVSKILKKLNHKITMVHCRQSMKNNCTAILAKGISVTEQGESSVKSKVICDLCLKNSLLAEKINPWNTEWLNNTPVTADKVSNERLWRFAGYEIVISQKGDFKKPKGKILAAWLERYKILVSLENQIQLILEKNKYDYAICYNSLYGIHQLFADKCNTAKIPFLSLHSSLHMGKENEFILYKNNVLSLLKEIKKRFRRQDRMISSKDKHNIRNHIAATIAGNKPWAYSSPPSNFDIQNKTNQESKKILVLLSSPDELLGFHLLGLSPKIKKPAFKDQIQWLKWIYHLAKKKPNWIFFLRPHPRLFPNKRENIKSPFVKKINILKNLKKSNNIIWPPQERQGSLWNHLGDTKLVLNAWSSASEIFQFYGVPVITFFPEFANSNRLVDVTAHNKKEYEKKICQILYGRRKPNKNKILWWLKCMLESNSFLLSSGDSVLMKLLRILLPSKILQNYEGALFRFKKPKTDVKYFKRLLYSLFSPIFKIV